MDGRPLALKVPIPRLARRHHEDEPSEKSIEPRVHKACHTCRKRKVKCSGELPHCQHCVDQSVPCVYPQARKDRLKDATEHINQCVTLLQDLSVHVDDAGQQKIDKLLDSLADDAPTPIAATATVEKQSKVRSAPVEVSRDDRRPEEAEVTGSVGSNNNLDLIDENLFQSHKSRATGFVGQNSEVQWFRSLKAGMGSPESAGPANRLPYGPKQKLEQCRDSVGLEYFRGYYKTMAADPNYWEFSSHSDVICYRGFWKDSGLSKTEFLGVMKEVAMLD